ncbi:hypothetical protein DM860_003788 [Cuscuta australis]|uniref:Uncharacterized protein n=1 Tax=Cuscuta australis TaxID=267555 RepID=A0A328DL64_9ASTE|nr:hypothetical protein DM860_003788 [Cuscuta australis]
MLRKNVDEEKKLKLNQPILSVRRISSSPKSSKDDDDKVKENDPVRSPGVVPFMWEDSPGKPKSSPRDRMVNVRHQCFENIEEQQETNFVFFKGSHATDKTNPHTKDFMIRLFLPANKGKGEEEHGGVGQLVCLPDRLLSYYIDYIPYLPSLHISGGPHQRAVSFAVTTDPRLPPPPSCQSPPSLRVMPSIKSPSPNPVAPFSPGHSAISAKISRSGDAVKEEGRWGGDLGGSGDEREAGAVICYLNDNWDLMCKYGKMFAKGGAWFRQGSFDLWMEFAAKMGTCNLNAYNLPV